MFHMLTCFNLKPGVTLDNFRRSVAVYEDHMKELRLVQTMGPIGQRQSDTIMDTDRERDHQYFFMTSFLDRAQCDRSVEHILRREEPAQSIHRDVYSKVTDQVFICWQDL